jgi:Pyridoxamine 5'-phosphate oxidase
MADQFPDLSEKLQDFIARQQVFFTGSAAGTGRVNISPRPMGCFRILDKSTVAYLDLIGSGNETAAHLRLTPRLTMMFCAFSGAPQILRLYGCGQTHTKGTDTFDTLLTDHFDNSAPRNARQIVVLDIDLVQTSCGYGVPLFDYRGERQSLSRWAAARTDADLAAFQQENGQFSIDGFPAQARSDA